MKNKYDYTKEYINIENYSPFSFINEVSAKYRFRPFKMPFVNVEGKEYPVHPDTFTDLSLNKKDVAREIKVFPTSSFRTVYFPDENICYKVPVLRKITRGIRNLSNKSLRRSEEAGKALKKTECDNFSFLEEECFYGPKEEFNYIKRRMPDVDIFPWFFVVKSQKFDKEFLMKAIENIIKTWMFFASNDIYLEYHTQNILVDEKADIYYRDLSDVRSTSVEILKPSYLKTAKDGEEILSVVFDRTVCRQNLDHVFRYDTILGNDLKGKIKDTIKYYIGRYDLKFPPYSMDFPVRTGLVEWRR